MKVPAEGKAWLLVGLLFTLSIGWTILDMVSFVNETEETEKADKKISALKKEIQQRKDLLENLEADSFVKKSWHPGVYAKRKSFFKKEITELEVKLQDLEKRREIRENPPTLIDLPSEVLATGQ
jgi:hypothetical protein